MTKSMLVMLLLTNLCAFIHGQSIPKVMCTANGKQFSVEKPATGKPILVLEDIKTKEVLFHFITDIQDDTCICTDTSVTWLDNKAWYTSVYQIQYKNGTWENFVIIDDFPTRGPTVGFIRPGGAIELYSFKLTSIETLEAELTVKYMPMEMEDRKFPTEKYHITYKLDFKKEKFSVDKKIRLE